MACNAWTACGTVRSDSDVERERLRNCYAGTMVTADHSLPRARATRWLITGQGFLWVAYLLAVALAIVAANRYGSFEFSPFGNGEVVDPQQVLSTGMGDYYFVGILMVVNVISPIACIGLALTGAAMLVKARTTGAAISRLLAVGTVATAFLAAVQLTPWGALLRTWLLD